jgi:hypothetical protein
LVIRKASRTGKIVFRNILPFGHYSRIVGRPFRVTGCVAHAGSEFMCGQTGKLSVHLIFIQKKKLHKHRRNKKGRPFLAALEFC